MSAPSMVDVHGRFAQLVESRFGLTLQHDSPALATAIATLAERYHLQVGALLDLVRSNATILRELAGCLGVPETYFFRHPEVFEELVEFISQLLLRQDVVTVWSVGCCRGEEAYSLAIALDAHFGHAWRGRVCIKGCDISLDALSAAREAVYGKWSFRTPRSTERGFDQLPDGRWRLQAHLRAAVQFEHLSAQELASHLEPTSVDVLLFRNVAVYFAPESVQQVYQAFATALRPGGILCVATTDPVPHVPGLFAANIALGLHEKGETSRKGRSGCVSSPMRRMSASSLFALSHSHSVNDNQPRVTRRSPAPRRRATIHRTSGDLLVERAPRSTRHTPLPQRARTLADAGRVNEALELLDKTGQSTQPNAALHLLRGQICVGAGRIEQATIEFRRVLYLEPAHLLGRYWAALAFARAQQAKQALLHALELERLLKLNDDTVLEDGSTTVRELRQALAELKERLT